MDGFTVAFVLLGFFGGLWFVRRVRNAKQAMLENFDIPVFLPVVPGTTCSDKNQPHSWQTISGYDPYSKETKDHMVCMECGVVSGTDKQFSPDGLEKLKVQLQNLEAEKKAREELELLMMQEAEEDWADYLRRTPEVSSDEKGTFMAGLFSGKDLQRRAIRKFQERQKERLAEKVKDIPGIVK